MSNLEKLVNIMRELRNPEKGCPWDLEQTFASIAPYTIEEAYEVADAIQRMNMKDLQDELGDLLFQVVFHAQMATEAGAFTIDDVLTSIVEKMVRRHPHVFGDEKIMSAQQQTVAWEAHKEAERGKKQQNTDMEQSILSDIPVALPALTRAVKLQRRAARVGFDWTKVSEIFDKIREELEEVRHEVDVSAPRVRLEDEIGDLFFAVTNLARRLDIDPESAIRGSNAKFENRFRGMEAMAREQKSDLNAMSLDEMEMLYQRIKQMEKSSQDEGK